MENTIVRACPKCGNNVEGNPIEGKGRAIAKGLAKGGVHLGADMIIPGLGKYAGDLLGDAVNKSVDLAIGEKEYEFCCYKCGYIWKALPSMTYPPDDYIENHRKSKLSEMHPSLIGSVITGVLSCLCLFYCCTHESSTERTVEGNIFTLGQDLHVTDYNLEWWFLGFLLIVFGFITIALTCNYLQKLEDIAKIKNMSLHEYYIEYMK